MSKKITNTAKEEAHPEWTLGGNPNAIYAQEARGQRELVNSESLPTEGSGGLEKFGIQLGEPHPDDPIFRDAVLPEGWRKQPTEHSMWSEVVDAGGVVRLSIFYKAAFYDRSAHMNVSHRYRVDYMDPDNYEDRRQMVVDTATGKVLFRADSERREGEKDYQWGERNRETCRNWLVENYPDYADPFAYWE